jgi:hypothetical protein
LLVEILAGTRVPLEEPLKALVPAPTSPLFGESAIAKISRVLSYRKVPSPVDVSSKKELPELPNVYAGPRRGDGAPMN